MSQTDISYSCGSCGFPLNLSSLNHITSGIASEYQKSIKKGFISFLFADLSRFTQVDEVNCLLVTWGCYGPKTKLLCHKCGVHIGYGYGYSPALCGFDSLNTTSSAFRYKDPSTTAFRRLPIRSLWKIYLVMDAPISRTCLKIASVIFSNSFVVAPILSRLV